MGTRKKKKNTAMQHLYCKVWQEGITLLLRTERCGRKKGQKKREICRISVICLVN